ncbi:MAG: hypothetical protein LWW81_05645, partial [Rhodocyclales bacterium]|nr:hypothetical protein [Rhodocyclales bacterium]
MKKRPILRLTAKSGAFSWAGDLQVEVSEAGGKTPSRLMANGIAKPLQSHQSRATRDSSRRTYTAKTPDKLGNCCFCQVNIRNICH